MEKVREDKSKTVKIRIGDIDPARIINDVREVVRDLKTLAERMQDIVANNGIPVGIFDVGVVMSIASGGSSDFTLTLGTGKGVMDASKAIMENVAETLSTATSDKSSKDSEKDNG